MQAKQTYKSTLQSMAIVHIADTKVLKFENILWYLLFQFAKIRYEYGNCLKIFRWNKKSGLNKKFSFLSIKFCNITVTLTFLFQILTGTVNPETKAKIISTIQVCSKTCRYDFISFEVFFIINIINNEFKTIDKTLVTHALILYTT